MPLLATENLGPISYDPSDVYNFPSGLPAFENERSFLLVEQPHTAPVVFLQSVETPGLAFITLPIDLVAPGYECRPGPGDRKALGMAGGGDVGDLIRLAIITIAGGAVTANLRAPVLLSPASRRAVQLVPAESPYSPQHPVGEALCS